MIDGKNSPGLRPWWRDTGDEDPVQQRIATLFGRLQVPPEADPRRLSRMRARLDAAVRPRSARRSRVWVWALTGSLLLLVSGVVVAARGWVPEWIGFAAPESSRSARAHKVVRIADEQAQPAPAAAPPVEPLPAVRSVAVAVATPGVRPRAQVAPQSEAALLETAVARLRRDRDGAGTLQILDRYDARFARGVLRGEATRLRVDALLLTEDRAGALSLLEGLTLSSGSRDVELALIRGELLAARGDCRRALADFDRVTATTAASALRRRAQTGRNECEMRLGQPASAPR